MSSLWIPYWFGLTQVLPGNVRNRQCITFVQPDGAAPACEKSFKIRETTRVAALSDIVEEMPSAAVTVFPALG
jgi:hypothetical protein